MTQGSVEFPLDDPRIRDRWTALEETSVFVSPFATLNYAQCYVRATGAPIRVFFSRDPDTEYDRAAVILAEIQKGPFSFGTTLPLAPFSCLIAHALPSETSTHHDRSWITPLSSHLDKRFDRADLLLPPSFGDVRGFQWNGWNAAPLYTSRLPVVDPDATIASWTESARRTYRKHTDGYEIIESPDLIDSIVTLNHLAARKKSRIQVLSKEETTDFAKNLVATGVARCFGAVHAGSSDPDAGIIVLSSGTEAYYWLAGSVPGSAMTVLIGGLLRILADTGLEGLDFVGANTTTVAEFKRRFHPELVSYYHVYRTPSKTLRILQVLRALASSH